MRRILTLIIITALMAAVNSCELERSSRGNLYGFWHLLSVDTIGGGSTDLRQQLFFYAVQSRLVELSDRNDQYSSVVSRFERVGDSLFLERLHYSDREQGDPEVTDITRVAPWGINTLSPRLRIERLNSGKLILSNGNLRMNMEKM